jgi:ribose transport system substrate-binding protein
MKKIVALVLSLVMVFTLAACSKDSTDTSTAADTANDTTPAGSDAVSGKTYDVIYLTPSTASQFWTYVGIGIENAITDMEASEGITVNFSTVGPAEESQTEDYVTAFEECIAKKPDAIVTATLAINTTITKALEATKNGIVLNFVNCG